MLTDEQCNEFRGLPVSFNDMVRAIHADGYAQALKDAAEVCEAKALRCEKEAQAAIDSGELDDVSAIRSTAWQISVCAAAILALGKE